MESSEVLYACSAPFLLHELQSGALSINLPAAGIGSLVACGLHLHLQPACTLCHTLDAPVSNADY
jgi:hypothetical protein